jgi:hypothetical protein
MVVAYFKVLPRHFPGETGERNNNLWLFNVPVDIRTAQLARTSQKRDRLSSQIARIA